MWVWRAVCTRGISGGEDVAGCWCLLLVPAHGSVKRSVGRRKRLPPSNRKTLHVNVGQTLPSAKPGDSFRFFPRPVSEGTMVFAALLVAEGLQCVHAAGTQGREPACEEGD